MAGWGVNSWNGTAWVAEDDLPFPGRDEISVENIETAVFVRTHDGGTLKVKPEVPIEDVQGRIPLTFLRRTTRDLYYRLKDYCHSGTGLQLLTHVPGVWISGSFAQVIERWPLKWTGEGTQKYNVETQFVIYDVTETD